MQNYLRCIREKDLAWRKAEFTFESDLPATARRNFLLTQWEVACEKMGSLGHANINANDGSFGNRHFWSSTKDIL